jgi:hypothetical protein
MNLTIKSRKVQLNGNEITGDTYPVKQWIKTYLNGKWNADKKAWIVDLGQVKTWTGTCIQIDNTPATETRTTSRHISELCPKCHTYCYGDCES